MQYNSGTIINKQKTSETKKNIQKSEMIKKICKNTI